MSNHGRMNICVFCAARVFLACVDDGALLLDGPREPVCVVTAGLVEGRVGSERMGRRGRKEE
jgi:hypothetical protein